MKDRGQLNEAIFCYQRAIAINPEFVISLANLANVYKDIGKVVEAIDLYQRAIGIKPDFVEVFYSILTFRHSAIIRTLFSLFVTGKIGMKISIVSAIS